MRPFRSDDAAEFQRVVTQSLPHLRPWMDWAAESYDLDAAEAFLAGIARNSDSLTYAITDGEGIVGVVGAEMHNTFAEIGYWLHPAHTGRGLVTLAAADLIELAFAREGIERVEIWHDAANSASSGVPRRLGFTQVARRTPPREPAFGGKIGIDVVWELRRGQFLKLR